MFLKNFNLQGLSRKQAGGAVLSELTELKFRGRMMEESLPTC